MGNHSSGHRNQKPKNLLRRMRKAIIMGYLLLVFPTLIIYFLLINFTSLTGRMLIYSLFPAIMVLLVLYILYLIKPNLFPSFWESKNHQNENL